ncbi:NADPH2:quinone reductase [Kribbella aluminosa]|uniref:NADPH2:quinone reductase n=1 Tax=Kribbella aluminosa TaxID=416017 RepID=A0ABS4V0X2_9ACTN|nr:zinc-binding dehydrogenase [Kribbella aluminosa]MBP2357555.1 NADPH2:quinone reductase [Kribbella aluminosa]
MKAIRLHAFGPAENLVYEEVPEPVPPAGAVLVEVEAAGVHLVDTMIRAGATGGSPIPVPELPTVPGREVAGRVSAAGPDVDPSWIGKRVVVHLGMVPGGYAERAVAKVESLYELPGHVDAAQAVAAIGTGRTTAGILQQARLTMEDVVLVTSAAGGIGSYLIQAARNVGAIAVGLAGGPEKAELVRSLGAQYAIDYRDPDWAQTLKDALDGQEITVLLDGVGGTNGQQAFDLLGTGGRAFLFGWSGGGPIEFTHQDLMTRNLTVGWSLGAKMASRLRELESTALEETFEGRWQAVTTAFPLSDAATAHKSLETRATTGKVVLIP